jgi:hypothetical protein
MSISGNGMSFVCDDGAGVCKVKKFFSKMTSVGQSVINIILEAFETALFNPGTCDKPFLFVY